MDAMLYDALAPLAAAAKDDSAGAPFYSPSEALIRAIEEEGQLRDARSCGLAASMGEIVVRGVDPAADGKRRALFTVGRDLHVGIARSFGERLIEAGPRRLNPIMFPHTLPSAAAVTLGAIAKAHLCALVFDGEYAFYDALEAAQLLLEGAAADDVLLIVLDSANAQQTVGDRSLCALGLLLRRTSGPGKGTRLLFERTSNGDCLPRRNRSANDLRLLTRIAAGTADHAKIGSFFVSCVGGNEMSKQVSR